MSTNRLLHSASPYLLQHAHNPVDWYPWCDEARNRARTEDKPIFLSIGYSACHWCHVMAHESFEDEAIAAVLNQHFISIKVDREERPDLDAIYMLATQRMTGRGGWPNSVWLLPDGRPWYAGTYFPPVDRPGRTGFRSLLLQLVTIWDTRRPDVNEQAEILTNSIRQQAEATATPIAAADPQTLIGHAIAHLQDTFDARHGGFGEAPKFPPHAALALLLEEHQLTPSSTLHTLLTGTLDALQRGGIHDHLGGGFHRYATDASWLVPHFEKMLYDNAQLARSFTDAWHQFGEPTYRATAEDTLDWVLREMTDPAGGFHSALDADSDGEEGKFYTWTHAEIGHALGPEVGDQFCQLYHIHPRGNFHHESSGRLTGLNIPHLDSTETPADTLSDSRRQLLNIRAQRIWPGRDDKIITSWNGLMIGALAHAGQLLTRPDYIAAASRAAGFLHGLTGEQGDLPRAWRKGTRSGPGFLEDYAALANALFDLHAASGEACWLDQALSLTRKMTDKFYDHPSGVFLSTTAEHGPQLAALIDVFDDATPSANGLALRALRRAIEAGATDLIAVENQARSAILPRLQRLPWGCCALLLALRHGPKPTCA